MPEHSTHLPVAVLGCGLMGSGVARILAASGRPVRVWNRTSAKARVLAEAPLISAAATPEEACDGAAVVLVVVEGYEIVRRVLEELSDLSNKVIVNLTTGTSGDASRMRDWVEGSGGRYLDGTVLCYPQDLGSARGLVVYAGSRELFVELEEVLTTIGASARFVSPNVDGANVCAVSSTFFIAALAAFAESSSYILTSGIEADDLLAVSRSLVDRLSWQFTELTEAVRTGDVDTDRATVDAYAAAATTFRGAMRTAGVESVMMAATEQLLARAQGAGYGTSAIASVSRVCVPVPG